jgi:hypothetical protein
MIDYSKISDIFCLVDEFCKDFDITTPPFLLGNPSKRLSMMSKSEIISICLFFISVDLGASSIFICFTLSAICRANTQKQYRITVSWNLASRWSCR